MSNMIFDLKLLRDSFGYSQVKLAQESNVSLPTIQNIESGKGNPTIDVLEKLTKSLGFELKLVPLEFDVDVAIGLGVPLTTSTKTRRKFLPTIQMLKLESRRWVHCLEQGRLTERDEMALVSFLMAIKDHFPAFFDREMTCPVFIRKIDASRNSGKVLKLRRIALSNLSRYL